MYQINTIIAAVQLALDAKESAAVTAILKHYLMDDHYVPREIRQEVLKGVNAHFETKYSVTTIKKANPTTLNGIKIKLPEKEILVPADNVKGSTEIPADLIAANPNATSKETTTMQTSATVKEANNNNPVAEALDTVAAVAPKGPVKVKKVDKKDKANKVSANDTVELAKADGVRFAKAFAEAFKKGKTKKGDHHMVLSLAGNDLTPDRVAGVYDFFKPSIKVLIEVMSEIDGLKTKEEREATFTAWIADDKDRSKAFKKFRKVTVEDVKKFDHVIGLFLLTAEENLKAAVSLAVYANEQAKDDSDDTYAFIRKNQDGINPRWSCAIAAGIGGGVDMALHGMSIGSVVGTAVGAGAAFFAGDMLEDIESNNLRSFAAGALGASFGVAGSRLGRYAGSVVSGTEVEVHDGNIVATIPAQQVISHTTVQPAPTEQQAKPGLLGGITDYLLG